VHSENFVPAHILKIPIVLREVDGGVASKCYKFHQECVTGASKTVGFWGDVIP
jgi:hypothetical protein